MFGANVYPDQDNPSTKGERIAQLLNIYAWCLVGKCGVSYLTQARFYITPFLCNVFRNMVDKYGLFCVDLPKEIL